MSSNMYLLITPASGTLDGESTDNEHPKWMEIFSFSHSQSQAMTHTTSSSGGRTAERVHHSDFTVSKYMDRSTPIINQNTSSGTHYKLVTIQLYRATADGDKPVKYMEYIMTDVVISNYSVGGGSGDIPVETLSFNYTSIKWSYIPQKKDAPGGLDTAIPGGWSLMTNKKI